MTKKKKQKAETGSQNAEDFRRQVEKEAEPSKNEMVLLSMLALEPALMNKLLEAFQSMRFFITVSFQKKYNPDDEHDYHHYYIRKNFMINDVVPSLKHIASDFTAKENPTAELPDKKGWH